MGIFGKMQKGRHDYSEELSEEPEACLLPGFVVMVVRSRLKGRSACRLLPG